MKLESKAIDATPGIRLMKRRMNTVVLLVLPWFFAWFLTSVAILSIHKGTSLRDTLSFSNFNAKIEKSYPFVEPTHPSLVLASKILLYICSISAVVGIITLSKLWKCPNCKKRLHGDFSLLGTIRNWKEGNYWGLSESCYECGARLRNKSS